jgi:hypothetical protein
MPTNPLWLEHTERAAWDTVQVLREQVQTERARVDLLMRTQQQWPKILEALTALAAEHGLAEREPLLIVQTLSSELRRLQSQSSQKPSASSELPAYREPGALQTKEAEQKLPVSASRRALRYFFKRIERVESRHPRRKKRSLERLLEAMAAKLEGLDELEHAPQQQVAEQAAEMAHLAYCVLEARRR